MQFQNNLILPNSINQLKSLKNICRSRNDLFGQQKSCRVRPSSEQIAQVMSRSWAQFIVCDSEIRCHDPNEHFTYMHILVHIF